MKQHAHVPPQRIYTLRGTKTSNKYGHCWNKWQCPLLQANKKLFQTCSSKFCITLRRQSTYTKGWGKTVFEVGRYAHEQRFPASNHSHPSCQVTHHMMSCYSHSRFLRIQGKILPDYLFTSRHGNLNRTIHHRMDQLLHSPFNSLPYTLLQLWMGLKQGNLCGEKQVKSTACLNETSQLVISNCTQDFGIITRLTTNFHLQLTNEKLRKQYELQSRSSIPYTCDT